MKKVARRSDDVAILKNNIGKYINFSDNSRFGMRYFGNQYAYNPLGIYGLKLTEEICDGLILHGDIIEDGEHDPDEDLDSMLSISCHGFQRKGFINIFEPTGEVVNLDNIDIKSFNNSLFESIVNKYSKTEKNGLILDKYKIKELRSLLTSRNHQKHGFLYGAAAFLTSYGFFKNPNIASNSLLRSLGMSVVETNEQFFKDGFENQIIILNSTSCNLIANIKNPYHSVSYMRNVEPRKDGLWEERNRRYSQEIYGVMDDSEDQDDSNNVFANLLNLSNCFLKIARSKDPKVREAVKYKQDIDRIKKILQMGSGELYDLIRKRSVTYGHLEDTLDNLSRTLVHLTHYLESNATFKMLLSKQSDQSNDFVSKARDTFLKGRAFSRLITSLESHLKYTLFEEGGTDKFVTFYSDGLNKVINRWNEFQTQLNYLIERGFVDEMTATVPEKINGLISKLIPQMQVVIKQVTDPEEIYKGLIEHNLLWVLDYSNESKNRRVYGLGKARNYGIYLLRKGMDHDLVDDLNAYLESRDFTTKQLDKLVEIYNIDKSAENEWDKNIRFYTEEWSRNHDKKISEDSARVLNQYLDSGMSTFKEFKLTQDLDNKNNLRKHLYNLTKEYGLNLPLELIELFRYFCEHIESVKNKVKTLNKEGVKKFLFDFCKAYESYDMGKFPADMNYVGMIVNEYNGTFEKEITITSFMRIVKNIQLVLNHNHHWYEEETQEFILNNDFYKDNCSLHQYLIYSTFRSMGVPNKFGQMDYATYDDGSKYKYIESVYPGDKDLIETITKVNEAVTSGAKAKFIPNITEYYNKLLKVIAEAMIASLGELDIKDKVKEIFNLNVRGENYTFKALDQRDNRALMIGAETDCCQMLGKPGADAAIDSFVNSLAGVLVLYDNENKIMAQSYFHYVPEDNGYILDNVEINPHNPNCTKFKLTRAYAELAAYAKKHLDVQYFRCGLNYNKLKESEFAYGSDKKDKRKFEYGRYSDYSRVRFLDLLSPATFKPSGNLKPLDKP